MDILNITDAEGVNKTFCDLVGIKPIKAVLTNLDTHEERFYTSRTSVYKHPKDWKNVSTKIFKNPIYPDFTNPVNFLQLLDIHWYLFGNLGTVYNRVQDESFELNFLYHKLQAIIAMKGYGGSDVLDMFIQMVKDINFYIEEVPDDICEHATEKNI